MILTLSFRMDNCLQLQDYEQEYESFILAAMVLDLFSPLLSVPVPVSVRINITSNCTKIGCLTFFSSFLAEFFTYTYHN